MNRHGRPSAEKTARVDLGLALLSVARKPGQTLTVEDIAAWCECHHSAISTIERNALKKLREIAPELFAEIPHAK